MHPLVLLSALYLAIDYIWVGLLSKSMWQDNVLAIQNSPLTANMLYAALSYGLLIYGLWALIVEPGAPLWKAALYGLVVYGVFDLTNLAIFKNYSRAVGLLDMLWGAAVCTAVTALFRKLA